MKRLAPMLLMAALLAAGCSGLARRGHEGGMADLTGREMSRSRAKEVPATRAEALAHFATGLSYQLNHQPEKALDHFHQAALADPSNELLVVELARRYLQQKEHEKAFEILGRAGREPTASGNVFALLARAHMLEGRTNAAFKAARQAVRKSPDLLGGYQMLAELYLGQGKNRDALKVLQQAEKQPDPEAPFLANLAELYHAYATAHPEESEALQPKIGALLERAAQRDPENPNLLHRLADHLQMTGQSERAATIYLELLDDYSDLPLLRDTLREKLAHIYFNSSNKAKAAEQLLALVRDNPTRYPQAWYFLGAIAYDEGELGKAAEYFDKVLLLNPSAEQVYYDLAGMQINNGHPQDALRTLERARARFPQNFVAEFLSALAQSRLKDYSKALQHFTAAEIIARAGEPQRLTHVFYFQLGATFERNKDYEQAANYFRKCLDMQPDFDEALNYLGYMWADLGINLQEARALIEKAVAIEPENAAYIDSLGWVFFRLGQPREALKYILKAIELSEEPDATIYDHLGDIYQVLNEPEKAREAWRKSIEIEPNEEIQKKLEKTGPTEETEP
jgi:tetratricopeptide (TPR) repeat protein